MCVRPDTFYVKRNSFFTDLRNAQYRAYALFIIFCNSARSFSRVIVMVRVYNIKILLTKSQVMNCVSACRGLSQSWLINFTSRELSVRASMYEI